MIPPPLHLARRRVERTDVWRLGRQMEDPTVGSLDAHTDPHAAVDLHLPHGAPDALVHLPTDRSGESGDPVLLVGGMVPYFAKNLASIERVGALPPTLDSDIMLRGSAPLPTGDGAATWSSVLDRIARSCARDEWSRQAVGLLHAPLRRGARRR